MEYLRARSQLYFTHRRQTPPTGSRPQPWHSPGSLLMGLAGSLEAAGTLRLALCSFQYSRQCRSCEWMKRHMSQAWATHTSSSMPSLQTGREGSEGEEGGVGAAGPDLCSSCGPSSAQPLAPGRLSASVSLHYSFSNGR